MKLSSEIPIITKTRLFYEIKNLTEIETLPFEYIWSEYFD